MCVCSYGCNGWRTLFPCPGWPILTPAEDCAAIVLVPWPKHPDPCHTGVSNPRGKGGGSRRPGEEVATAGGCVRTWNGGHPSSPRRAEHMMVAACASSDPWRGRDERESRSPTGVTAQPVVQPQLHSETGPPDPGDGCIKGGVWLCAISLTPCSGITSASERVTSPGKGNPHAQAFPSPCWSPGESGHERETRHATRESVRLAGDAMGTCCCISRIEAKATDQPRDRTLGSHQARPLGIGRREIER